MKNDLPPAWISLTINCESTLLDLIKLLTPQTAYGLAIPRLQSSLLVFAFTSFCFPLYVHMPIFLIDCFGDDLQAVFICMALWESVSRHIALLPHAYRSKPLYLFDDSLHPVNSYPLMFLSVLSTTQLAQSYTCNFPPLLPENTTPGC